MYSLTWKELQQCSLICGKEPLATKSSTSRALKDESEVSWCLRLCCLTTSCIPEPLVLSSHPQMHIEEVTFRSQKRLCCMANVPRNAHFKVLLQTPATCTSSHLPLLNPRGEVTGVTSSLCYRAGMQPWASRTPSMPPLRIAGKARCLLQQWRV